MLKKENWRLVLTLVVIAFLIVSAKFAHNSHQQPEHSGNPQPAKGESHNCDPNQSVRFVKYHVRPTSSLAFNSPALKHSPQKKRCASEQPKQEYDWTKYFPEKSSDWLLVLFNGILALFTIRLWQSTEKLWESGAALERAYMFIEPRKPEFPSGNIMYPDTTPGDEAVSVYYAFVNHGRTPAVISGLDVHFQILTNAPDNTLALPPNTILENDRVVEPSVTWKKTTHELGHSLNSDQLKALKEGQAFLWLYGSIVYEDVFGNERRTRFRWCYNGLSDLFQAYGSKPYNERT